MAEVDADRSGGEGRGVVYCLIPRELAGKLHDRLRAHFADRPEVEVLVESRLIQRRADGERRRLEAGPPPSGERRMIRSAAGRRIAERRAATVLSTEPPALPRRARPYADRITFFRRFEPGSEKLEDIDTARLITRIQLGDAEEAFTVLYARYFDRVYGYLRIALNDAHEAEDCTQEVFIKLLGALPAYERRRQPFRAWLFTIARNHAVDHLRRLGRIDAVEPGELASENGEVSDAQPRLDVLDWIDDRDLLMLVNRLPESQRQVLVMRFLLDLSSRQVATALGRKPSDVRALQTRAVRFLQARLRALGREPRPGSRRFQRRRLREAPILRQRRHSLSP